jgi:hypothetical protein
MMMIPPLPQHVESGAINRGSLNQRDSFEEAAEPLMADFEDGKGK